MPARKLSGITQLATASLGLAHHAENREHAEKGSAGHQRQKRHRPSASSSARRRIEAEVARKTMTVANARNTMAPTSQPITAHTAGLT